MRTASDRPAADTRRAPSATGSRRPAGTPAPSLPERAGRVARRWLAGLVRPWGRLGVRARVTAIFGLGAFGLSVTMGFLSYVTVRHFLVSDQQKAAQQQAYVSADEVRSNLLAHDQLATAVNKLSPPSGSNSVVYSGGRWEAYYPGGRSSLSPTLRHVVVVRSTPATQTYSLSGTPTIGVGIPLPAVGADYFQVVSLADLAHTLRVLELTLAAVGAATTLLGAVVGRWASGRAVRPLAGVSRAAVAIAGGRLDTRLPASSTEPDPDLEGLTASFNRMVDQLQERIEREARFTSDVSHELRSPLTTLQNSLDVLEGDVRSSGERLPPRAATALELLRAEVDRFQGMVADLLEISRVDAGSSDLFFEEVLAGELVRRSVAAHRPPDGFAGEPEVVVSDEAAEAHLRVDKRRFERIMANLLDNAALYAGGATRVTAEVVDGRGDGAARRAVRVAVEDQGPGIPAAERNRVFERFYRGGVSGRRGSGTGTGLGLALVADHVRLHGGQTWVEAVQDGGARFVVELPVEEEAP